MRKSGSEWDSEGDSETEVFRVGHRRLTFSRLGTQAAMSAAVARVRCCWEEAL